MSGSDVTVSPWSRGGGAADVVMQLGGLPLDERAPEYVLVSAAPCPGMNYTVSQKTSTFLFWNNSLSKINRF